MAMAIGMRTGSAKAWATTVSSIVALAIGAGMACPAAAQTTPETTNTAPATIAPNAQGQDQASDIVVTGTRLRFRASENALRDVQVHLIAIKVCIVRSRDR